MSTGTKIEWTQATWNPVVGCTKVSEGCRHCYAERMAARLATMGRSETYGKVVKLDYDGQDIHPLPQWNGEVVTIEKEEGSVDQAHEGGKGL